MSKRDPEGVSEELTMLFPNMCPAFLGMLNVWNPLSYLFMMYAFYIHIYLPIEN